MGEHPHVIMAKSDEELREWTLSGADLSYQHQMGQTEMSMRCALRTAEASQQMATANRELVGYTQMMVDANQAMAEANRQLVDWTRTMVEANRDLVKQTRNLVWSTWGVVAITLLTQVATIVVLLTKK